MSVWLSHSSACSIHISYTVGRGSVSLACQYNTNRKCSYKLAQDKLTSHNVVFVANKLLRHSRTLYLTGKGHHSDMACFT